MKKARIIYNPTAGREAFKKEIAIVLEQLEIAGYESCAHATTCEGDATQAALAAGERAFYLISAVGADGTLTHVINGVRGQAYTSKSGMIPACTTNVFARALDSPRNIQEAVDIIVANQS